MAKRIRGDSDKLLDLYCAGKLDEETNRLVHGWLSSDEDREVKDALIARLFDRIISRKCGLDEYTVRSLAALHEELGFTDRRIGIPVVPLARRKSFRFLVATVAAAAAIVAGVFIVPDLIRGPQTVPLAEVTIAATDSIREVVFPDGSTVRLGAATTLSHADDFARNRRVTLDGEAFFSVVRDEVHPFTVESHGMKVTVLGTEFGVRSFGGDECAEVALASGKVEVSMGEVTVTLKPNEWATIDRNTRQIELEEIGEGELLRLRGINLSLNDVSLDEAFRLIGGFYDVRMKVSAGIPHVDGIILKLNDDATLEEVLFLLHAINPVFDYAIGEGQVTITKL